MGKASLPQKAGNTWTEGIHDPSICEFSQGNGPNRKELRTEEPEQTDRGSCQDSSMPGGWDRGQECREKRDESGSQQNPAWTSPGPEDFRMRA